MCLVGGSTTLVRAKVEANLPRKRGPAIAGYDKAWDKFMEQVMRQGLRGSIREACYLMPSDNTPCLDKILHTYLHIWQVAEEPAGICSTSRVMARAPLPVVAR